MRDQDPEPPSLEGCVCRMEALALALMAVVGVAAPLAVSYRIELVLKASLLQAHHGRRLVVRPPAWVRPLRAGLQRACSEGNGSGDTGGSEGVANSGAFCGCNVPAAAVLLLAVLAAAAQVLWLLSEAAVMLLDPCCRAPASNQGCLPP